MHSTTATAPDRHRTSAVALAALLGLALVAAMITRTSQAAFSATTDNTGNYFNGGTVTLTDDDGGVSALFAVDAMEPGDTVTGCIQVSYDGTITTPSAVKVYGAGYTNVAGADAASVGLSDHLVVTIEEGTGAVFNDCSAFTSTATVLAATDLTSFNTANADYATGVGSWTPTATGETRAYRVTVELAATTPDAEEGAGTTDVAFVWEVQS